jgi:putative flavoprotein involved in K+ transport
LIEWQIQEGTNGMVPVGTGETLKAGDDAYFGFLDLVDRHVTNEGWDIPQEPAARATHPDPIYVTDPILRLDLRKAGINSIIWATGYRYDFGWIDIPVFDDRGEPRHRVGVSEVPGLYFLGLPWLSKMNSSFLAGIGDDAAHLAKIIATTAVLKHERPASSLSRVEA